MWPCRAAVAAARVACGRDIAAERIGIAVGMYVSPKWTIPRVIGSMAEQAWFRAHRC